jgi:MFS family permease
MTRFRISLSAGGMIAAVFVGQALGMAGIVSFPALLPQFQHLWSLSSGQAGFISGIYFAGCIVSVPALSALTDRLDPRRIYVASLLFGAATALGFALFASGAASASRGGFCKGRRSAEPTCRECERSRTRSRQIRRRGPSRSTPQPSRSG